MSSSAYDVVSSDPQLGSRKRRPTHGAPNNAGIMLLAIALLLVVAITAFIGAPAFLELREQTSCVAVAGEPMQSGQSGPACKR